MLSNIWKHPKTSAVGVLIAITTVVGVLTQQGVTLGKAGTGTVVALVGAIASAFLGLLSKDPESSSAPAASSSGESYHFAPRWRELAGTTNRDPRAGHKAAGFHFRNFAARATSAA